MNYYATIAAVKRHLGELDPGDDVYLGEVIEECSRLIDGPEGANRSFFVAHETRFFDCGASAHELVVDDLLQLDTLTMDSELDGTHALKPLQHRQIGRVGVPNALVAAPAAAALA